MQVFVVLLAVLGLGGVSWQAFENGGMRLAGAALIGAVAGIALYHAAFGFTGAWRRFTREGRGTGLRAQMLLLAVCVVVTFPLIGSGTANGWVFPVGVASAFGAVIFGIGMQLGGGCGSGTLFTAGGGSVRMMITLAAFVGGSVLWTGTAGMWRGLPSLGAHSAIREFGVPLALIGTLGLLMIIACVSAAVERNRHGTLEEVRATGSITQGPWSIWLGALVLACVVIATFLVLGRPWGITSAFPLWGVKALDVMGVPIQEFNGWSDRQVAQSVFAHSTSVMDFGLMLGALAAAGMAARYAPSIKLSFRDLATAIIGGLLMGYGARLAYGCNIGGFLGGVVSGSLHGWWWLVFGYIGSIGGVWVREKIGMDEPMVRA